MSLSAPVSAVSIICPCFCLCLCVGALCRSVPVSVSLSLWSQSQYLTWSSDGQHGKSSPQSEPTQQIVSLGLSLWSSLCLCLCALCLCLGLSFSILCLCLSVFCAHSLFLFSQLRIPVRSISLPIFSDVNPKTSNALCSQRSYERVTKPQSHFAMTSLIVVISVFRLGGVHCVYGCCEGCCLS